MTSLLTFKAARVAAANVPTPRLPTTRLLVRKTQFVHALIAASAAAQLAAQLANAPTPAPPQAVLGGKVSLLNFPSHTRREVSDFKSVPGPSSSWR